MKMNRRCFRVLFLAVLLLGTQVSGCFAANDTKGSDAQVYLKKAMTAMSSLHGYRVEMAVDVILPMAGASVMSEREFFMQPSFVSRTFAEMLFYDYEGKWQEMYARSYAKQDDRQMVEYQNIDHQWMKQKRPYCSTDLYDDGRMFLAHVKKAKVREQTAEYVLIDVTVDGKTVGRNMINVLGQQFPAQLHILRFIFRFADDITYTIGIDRQTGYLTRLDMDLSDAVKLHLADILKHPESVGLTIGVAEKEKFELMLRDFQLIMQMMISQHNQIESFEIPVEAIEANLEEEIGKT